MPKSVSSSGVSPSVPSGSDHEPAVARPRLESTSAVAPTEELRPITWGHVGFNQWGALPATPGRVGIVREKDEYGSFLPRDGRLSFPSGLPSWTWREDWNAYEMVGPESPAQFFSLQEMGDRLRALKPDPGENHNAGGKPGPSGQDLSRLNEAADLLLHTVLELDRLNLSVGLLTSRNVLVSRSGPVSLVLPDLGFEYPPGSRVPTWLQLETGWSLLWDRKPQQQQAVSGDQRPPPGDAGRVVARIFIVILLGEDWLKERAKDRLNQGDRRQALEEKKKATDQMEVPCPGNPENATSHGVGSWQRYQRPEYFLPECSVPPEDYDPDTLDEVWAVLQQAALGDLSLEEFRARLDKTKAPLSQFFLSPWGGKKQLPPLQRGRSGWRSLAAAALLSAVVVVGWSLTRPSIHGPGPAPTGDSVVAAVDGPLPAESILQDDLDRFANAMELHQMEEVLVVLYDDEVRLCLDPDDRVRELWWKEKCRRRFSEACWQRYLQALEDPDLGRAYRAVKDMSQRLSRVQQLRTANDLLRQEEEQCLAAFRRFLRQWE